MFSLIVAFDRDYGIAKNGTIPWRASADLRHFKSLTETHVVVMGRKTYESIGHPLHNRVNVVISSTLIDNPDVIRVASCYDAVRHCITHCRDKKWFVIGGGMIYKWFMAQGLIGFYHITRIQGNYDCDTTFDWSMKGVVFVERRLLGDDVYTSYRSINVEETGFLNTIREIVDNGDQSTDRTGVGTLSVFGRQLKFNLRNNSFPLLTTRRMFLRGIFEELMLYIRGQTDNQILEEKKISVWRGNTTREFLDSRGLQRLPVGDMGASYGFLFRHFGATYKTCRDDYKGQGIDQLKNVIDTIKTNPGDRRMIISLWNPVQLDQCPLPPCLYNYQFYVSNGELSCMMTQRSSDIVVAGGWNIATGSLLTCMIASVTGLSPGELTWNIGNGHIYNNLVEQAKIQIDRMPYMFPKLFLKPREFIEDFQFSDLEVLGYQFHPAIEMVMNV